MADPVGMSLIDHRNSKRGPGVALVSGRRHAAARPLRATAGLGGGSGKGSGSSSSSQI